MRYSLRTGLFFYMLLTTVFGLALIFWKLNIKRKPPAILTPAAEAYNESHERIIPHSSE